MTNYRIVMRAVRDGRERAVEIAPDADCRLLEGGLIGFAAAGFDVRLTPYARRAGGYPQKRRFAERELGLSFEIVGENRDAVRRAVIALLDPGAEMTLDVTIGNTHRVIAVIPYDEAEFVQDTFYDTIEVTLLFVAPGVFFSDADDVIVPFRDAAPILTFPLNFMAGAGTVAGMYRTTDTATVDNPGDGDCGFVAHIAAVGGAVVHPGITCGDAHIACPMTLEDGDVLVIDTREARKNITKNGERTFVFDRDSRFFSLTPGENTLCVTCDAGDEYIEATVTFTPRYYGM